MYVVHPDWLHPRSKGVLINCEGFTQYIGSSSPLVDVASSLEVLFLLPGVISLTDGDAQGLVKRNTNHVVGVPQVAELGDLLKDVTDKVSNQGSKQSVPDQKFDFEFRLIVILLLILQAA
ncbi:hypothetical protein FF1_006411 [Malus domestica]